MRIQGEEGGAEVCQELFGGEADVLGGGSKKDEGTGEAGHQHSDDIQEFDRVGGQGQDRRDPFFVTLLRRAYGGQAAEGLPDADLESVVESELNDFGLETECATKDLANFGPVEFPGDAFTEQDGVFTAIWPSALADAGQGAVVAGNDLMITTAFPGAGNEIEGFAGLGPEEEGGEGFKIRFEMVLPDDVRGGAARDGFEGGPEVG